MSKLDARYSAIKNALSQFPDGASIEEIFKVSELRISNSTLRRRLAELLESGEITASGNTTARRYQLAKGIEMPYDFTLSEDSKNLLKILNRPYQERSATGYNREFLEGYRPNIDSYLTSEERKILADSGKTDQLDQPAGTYAKNVLNRLLIDLSWNSSRLEGNTYTLLDTTRLLSLGVEADNKSALDTQMIINHKEAINFLVYDTQDIGFNSYTFKNLHALLSNNLLADPSAEGRLRTTIIGIQKSQFIPLAIPQVIEEMFDLMLNKAAEIKDPFEQAFFIMVHLPYLQPFDDVNKRVSRLASNISLNSHNLAPLSFVDVPKDLYIQSLLAIYEFNRTELLRDVFMYAYKKSAGRYAAVIKSVGQPDLFRLKYRNEIQAIITGVIKRGLSKLETSHELDEEARKIPDMDRAKFIEYVETDLLSIHDGNFAKYRVTPKEFNRWKENWV